MSDDSKFGLAECLKELRSDLISTVEDGANKDLKFIVEDISLDLQIVASSGGKAGGGIKWWVLSADASTEQNSAVTQNLSLKLKVVDENGDPLPMSGTTS